LGGGGKKDQAPVPGKQKKVRRRSKEKRGEIYWLMKAGEWVANFPRKGGGVGLQMENAEKMWEGSIGGGEGAA